MTNTKNTKRALILSAIALLLCFSLLVGSTYAWFTDSVTSASSKIVSGSLKVDLEVLGEDGMWTSIKNDQSALFNYSKWEPGYTEYKVLKIENEGTLAFKWYAKFVSENAITKIADVIDVYVCPSETDELSHPADRSLTGYTKVGTLREFLNTISTTTYGALGGGDCAYLGIALKMREGAGNEYQGVTFGEFDIKIFATQNNVEEDGFDAQYDAGALYGDEVNA